MNDFGTDSAREVEALKAQLSEVYDTLQELVDAVGYIVIGPRAAKFKKTYGKARHLLDMKGA